MPLPIPQKSTALYFYRYRSPTKLEWLRETVLEHKIYLPNLRELNDDNDGLPHVAMQSEQEMADFLWDKFKQTHRHLTGEELLKHRQIILFNGATARPCCIAPEPC